MTFANDSFETDSFSTDSFLFDTIVIIPVYPQFTFSEFVYTGLEGSQMISTTLQNDPIPVMIPDSLEQFSLIASSLDQSINRRGEVDQPYIA